MGSDSSSSESSSEGKVGEVHCLWLIRFQPLNESESGFFNPPSWGRTLIGKTDASQAQSWACLAGKGIGLKAHIHQANEMIKKRIRAMERRSTLDLRERGKAGLVNRMDKLKSKWISRIPISSTLGSSLQKSKGQSIIYIYIISV